MSARRTDTGIIVKKKGSNRNSACSSSFYIGMGQWDSARITWPAIWSLQWRRLLETSTLIHTNDSESRSKKRRNNDPSSDDAPAK